MARSEASTAITTLKTLFALIDGTTGWHADFSGTGAVQVGKSMPADGPDSLIVIGDWSIDQDYAGLSESEYAFSVTVMARFPASSDDEETRLLDALDVADDIARIVIGYQQLRSNSYAPRLTFEPYQDAEPDAAGPILIVGRVTWKVLVDSLAGGL